jgi:hypothetical protein
LRHGCIGGQISALSQFAALAHALVFFFLCGNPRAFLAHGSCVEVFAVFSFRIRFAVFAAVAAASCSLPVAWSVPHQRVLGPPYVQDQTAQVESVCGRITSVEGNTFTLETPRSQNPSARSFQQDAQKVMTFTVDQNTTVEGKIEVGASADVTYRVQDGNNIAVSVRVASPQNQS